MTSDFALNRQTRRYAKAMGGVSPAPVDACLGLSSMSGINPLPLQDCLVAATHVFVLFFVLKTQRLRLLERFVL